MSHLLAVDAGNTRLKWSVHDGNGWRSKGAIPTLEAAQPGRLLNEWAPLSHSISRAIISNVAGIAIAAAIRNALERITVAPRIISSRREQCGVINHYAEPSQLGSDRWAALIGAHHARPRMQGEAAPMLVATAGTALTVDALTASGEFLGGLIIPGPALMSAALNRGTAGLPSAQGAYELFPSTTLNAITTGAVEACTGAIVRMHGHLALRTGSVPVCVLSGGAGEALLTQMRTLSFPVSFNENLVLDGLLAISDEPKSPQGR